MTEFEREVRAAVYQGFRETGRSPSAAELAAAVDASRADIRVALAGLAGAHALVLQPDGESIRMAHPFSGVPTDAVVTITDRQWFANCAWDGLAIIGLFGGTGRLETPSPATGAPIVFEVADGVVHGDGVVHFLVPAAHFWDDIVHT
jgi:hypothetical protein